MDEGRANIGKALIEEHLNGQHTSRQLEVLLKREGLELKNLSRGKGRIQAVLSDGRYRKTYSF